MSVATPARSSRWFRTRARPGSRPCQNCRKSITPGEVIAYRRNEGAPSDLLCQPCAETLGVWAVAAAGAALGPTQQEADGQHVFDPETVERARALGAAVAAHDEQVRATLGPPPGSAGFAVRHGASLVEALERMQLGLAIVDKGLADAVDAARRLVVSESMDDQAERQA